MNESVRIVALDDLISAALSRYEEEYLASLPQIEELNGRYPLAAKELRSVKKYQKRAEAEKKHGTSLTLVRLKRVAAVFLIAVSVTFGALMLNKEVRAAVLNVVLSNHDRYTELTFSGSDEGGADLNIYDFDVLSSVPEEYALTIERRDETSRHYDFTNEAGRSLYVGVHYSEGFSINVDSEHSTLEKVEIDGNEAYINVTDSSWPNPSEEPDHVAVIVKKGNIVLYVFGQEDRDTMVGIAEAIIKNKLVQPW